MHVEHIVNRGVSATRNYGMSLARGECLLFLDADDLLEEHSLATLLAHTGEADIICGSMTLHPDGQTFPLTDSLVVYPNLAAAVASGSWCFSPGSVVSVCAKLYGHTSVAARFDAGLRHAEDFSFNLEHLPYAGSLCVLPDVIYRYRRADEPSLDKRFWLDRFDVCKQILLRACQLFEGNESVMTAFGRYFVTEACQYFIALSDVQSLSESEQLLVMQTRLEDEILQQARIRSSSLPKGQQAVWLCIKDGHARLANPFLRRWGRTLWRWR